MNGEKVNILNHFIFVDSNISYLLQKEIDEFIFICKMLSFHLSAREIGNLVVLSIYKDDRCFCEMGFVKEEKLFNVWKKETYVFEVDSKLNKKDYMLSFFEKNKEELFFTGTSISVKQSYNAIIKILQIIRQELTNC